MNREEFEAKLEPLWYLAPNVSIGPGWYDIISKLVDDLAEAEPELMLLQVKEKFGGLRVYTTNYGDAVGKLIFAAEAESITTCEICGGPGTLGNRNGWYRTRCEECADVR